nr:nuclear transport factor 2-like isoform X5 [Lolium perenne]
MATESGNSDGSPHPNVIGIAFAQQYYKILNSQPEDVHKFYHDESTLGRPDSDGTLTTVTTTDAINEYFLSTELKDCLIELENIDTQPSLAGGVFIVVTGFFTMRDTVKHRFTQSFFLAPQETGGYYVLNDVLRYVREMPSPETNEAFVDHSNGNTQIAPFPAEPETSIKESLDPELPSAESVPVNCEVINPSAETTYVDVEVINPSSENIAVNDEVMDPSVESISVNDKVKTSVGNQNSQIKNGITKIPEAAPAPPASAHKDVIKKSYASIVKTKNESTQPAPVTKPIPRPKPTTKRAENVENSSSVPAKTTHAADTAPPNDRNIFDDQGYSIFVKNLPLDATVEIVEAEFRKFGAIKPCGIQVIHRESEGFSFGFVEFESQQSMYAAIEAAKIRFGSYVSVVQEKRTPRRVINYATHSNNNDNPRDSRVLPGRALFVNNGSNRDGDNFKGQGAGFVNNGNNRDGDNFRGQGANFVNNNKYHHGENFRGRFVNNDNHRDGNGMRNESRNQNEYPGRGRGLQGNDYRQNGNDYRQNRNGYSPNRSGYNQNRDGGYNQNREGGYNQNRDGGYNQNRDSYRQNGAGYRQNGNGYHQARPFYNDNGNGRSGRFNGTKQIPVAA